MSILYRNKDIKIELEEVGFLYYDGSVKRACEYVDKRKNGLGDSSEGIMEVVRAAIGRVKIADPLMKYPIRNMLLDTTESYLNIKYLTEGSRFHDYLMYDALSYYLDTHHIKVGNNRYQKTRIEITDKIVKRGSELHICSCGHEPVVEISPSIFDNVSVQIVCPRCGAKSMRLLDSGQMIKIGGGSYDTEHTYYNLEAAIDDCIKYWKTQCGKTTEYKALELLVSEFFGRLDVTENVRSYSKLLRQYVRSNKIDKGIEKNYECELAEQLYQDKTAMDIVNDYLWESSSNKDGDGMQPLATWDFSVYSLMKVN